MASPSPYFFLSYAHSDDRVNAATFFADLSDAVRTRAALPADEVVGFMDDEDVPLGIPWRSKVGEAIATCRSFIPLVSPGYVRSEECGREYQAFLTRIDDYARSAADGHRPRLLLPVHWEPGAHLPAEIAELGVTPNAMGEAYRSEGLGAMMKHYRRYQNEYHAVLTYLADEIVKRSVEYQMLPRVETPDLSTLESRFHRGQNRNGRSEKPRHVYFVVATSGRDDLLHVRRNVEYYGENCRFWMPYHPRLPDSIADYSYFVAKSAGYDSGLFTIDDLDELVERASQWQQIVVVIVDAWAARLAYQRSRLERYDQTKKPATAVVVPFSADDTETRSSSSDLLGTLQAVFRRRYYDRDLFRDELETHEEYGSQLLQVLRNAQQQLIRSRPPLDGPKEPPPGLKAP